MEECNSFSLSISDLMASLMLFFMFISISFMIYVEEENKIIKNIAIVYETSKINLNKLLHKEFDKDLKKWNAEITENNIFRFYIPFETGKSEIPKKFKKILDKFFPRYIKLVTNSKIVNMIKSINIEGHTSNIWQSAKNEKERYLNNLELSQERAKNVLIHCYDINNSIIVNNLKWLEKKFKANGMAYSHPVLKNNTIDWNKSKRVEFKIVTYSEKRIKEILDTIKNINGD